MALNFPDSPVAGTVFGAWRYDGVKWGAVSGVSGGGSAGDITAVLAGAGLSGGGTEGDVSIALAVPVTVARGGTGATDAATALVNLGGAPLASPTFTGDPKAPTPATADNDTSIATTAYVKAQGYQTGNQTITLSGDASGSGTTAITTTLATVNANVGTFQGLTVNAKGLVTAAASQSYLTAPVNLASQVTGTLPIANGGTGATTGAVGPYLPLVAGSGNALTGALTVTPASGDSTLNLRKSVTGTGSLILGSNGATPRWYLYLGEGTAEAGSNSGSDFLLMAANDAGSVVIAAPLKISRATGNVTMTGEVGFGTAGKILNASNYTQIYSGSTAALILGATSDPTSYYRNTTHAFQDIGGTATWARFNSGGTANISGAWTTISDAAAKINVAPYMTGLDVLLELQPVSFRYRGGFGDNGARTRVGLIAQQVAPLLPEIVGKSGDLMTLEPGNLIYCLINSIKTLAARVASLEGK